MTPTPLKEQRSSWQVHQRGECGVSCRYCREALGVSVKVEHHGRGDYTVWEVFGGLFQRFFRCRNRREVNECKQIIATQRQQQEGLWHGDH